MWTKQAIFNKTKMIQTKQLTERLWHQTPQPYQRETNITFTLRKRPGTISNINKE